MGKYGRHYEGEYHLIRASISPWCRRGAGGTTCRRGGRWRRTELAARRELLEETGYAFEDIQYVCTLFANPATSGNPTYTYILTGGEKVQEQELDASEDIEVVEMTLEEAKAFLLANKIGQALHSAALFYSFNKLGLL